MCARVQYLSTFTGNHPMTHAHTPEKQSTRNAAVDQQSNGEMAVDSWAYLDPPEWGYEQKFYTVCMYPGAPVYRIPSHRIYWHRTVNGGKHIVGADNHGAMLSEHWEDEHGNTYMPRGYYDGH